MNGQSAEDVKNEICDSGGSAIAVEADVPNSDEVAEMFKKATSNFETVDVLVNNAGLISPMLHFLKLMKHGGGG